MDERKPDSFDGEKWITCGGCGKRYDFEDMCHTKEYQEELDRYFAQKLGLQETPSKQEVQSERN